MAQIEKENLGIGLAVAKQTLLENSPLTTNSSVVAEVAARLGALKVAQIHDLPANMLETIYKSDGTPRTIADLESGRVIKRLIRKYFPLDAINEEETGLSAGEGSGIWYVDPLDGTSSFANGQEFSTVAVARYENGTPVVASIVNPFEREMIVAEKGKGSWRFSLDENQRVTAEPPVQIHVSEKANLSNGIAYFDALFNARTTAPKLELIKRLQQTYGEIGIRMTGSNIDQQRQVANGRADITLTDAVGGFHDLAAGALIITEAGGKFTSLDGEPVTESSQLALGSNGLLHDKLLELARECYKEYQGFR